MAQSGVLCGRLNVLCVSSPVLWSALAPSCIGWRIWARQRTDRREGSVAGDAETGEPTSAALRSVPRLLCLTRDAIRPRLVCAPEQNLHSPLIMSGKSPRRARSRSRSPAATPTSSSRRRSRARSPASAAASPARSSRRASRSPARRARSPAKSASAKKRKSASAAAAPEEQAWAVRGILDKRERVRHRPDTAARSRVRMRMGLDSVPPLALSPLILGCAYRSVPRCAL